MIVTPRTSAQYWTYLHARKSHYSLFCSDFTCQSIIVACFLCYNRFQSIQDQRENYEFANNKPGAIDCEVLGFINSCQNPFTGATINTIVRCRDLGWRFCFDEKFVLQGSADNFTTSRSEKSSISTLNSTAVNIIWSRMRLWSHQPHRNR